MDIKIKSIEKDIRKFDNIKNNYNGIIGNHFALSLINFINNEETSSYDKNEIIDLIYKFIDTYCMKDDKKSSSSTKSKKDGSGIMAYQSIIRQYKDEIYKKNPDISKSNATEQAREMYRNNKDSGEQKELYSSLVEKFKNPTNKKNNSDDEKNKIVFVSVKENTSDDEEDEIQPIKKKNINKNTKKSKNKKKGKMKKDYSSDSDLSNKESSDDDSSDDESDHLSKIKNNSSSDESSEDEL
tara:strand:+ start:230 stop:949 length:720 start_codon:yes stop_codon:yes gene_type:complete